MNYQHQVVQRLINLRKERGLSQKGVGELVGLSQQIISKIEKLERQVDYEVLYNYAKAFNVSADYLLGLATDFTTDDELKFVCNYTGLSAEAIEKIRKYCIPDLVSVQNRLFLEVDFLEVDNELRNKINISIAKRQKDIINDFILSSTFGDIITSFNDIKELNKPILSYLAIYFGDFEFFYKLQESDDKTVRNMHLFNKDFTDGLYTCDYIDGYDLFTMKVQKTIFNYIDSLFILSKFDDGKTLEFEAIQEFVYDAVESAFCENKTLNDIKTYINENYNDYCKGEVQKLKEIYEKFKKVI